MTLPNPLPAPDSTKPVRVRLLSPLGLYPRHPVSMPGGRLLMRDGLVVSAVETAPPEVHGLGDDHHSDLEILALEEVRFLAALALAVQPGRGMLFAYPLDPHLDVAAGLDDDAVLDLAAAHAARVAGDPWLRRGATLPAVAGGPAYDWRSEPVDVALVAELVSRAALSDHLLLRGLGALLRADMAWQHRPIAEAAQLMLYVALDATFQLVRRALIGLGTADPSHLDAGAYLDMAFNPGLDSGGYFTDFYETRIKVMHPSSNRFGVHAIAPLEADEYFALRQGLVDVFGFLITGRVLLPP